MICDEGYPRLPILVRYERMNITFFAQPETNSNNDRGSSNHGGGGSINLILGFKSLVCCCNYLDEERFLELERRRISIVSMEVSMRRRLNLLMFVLAASAAAAYAVEAAPTCCRGFKIFLADLNSQCPPSIPFLHPPILVDGGSFEEALSSAKENEYTAVLFYASSCPFSSNFRTQFSTLSSLYPKVKHLMVEKSSAMPSVFSRYGIHSVPSLLIVRHTTRTRYHGQKDLTSLIDFYKRITGINPAVDMVEDASHDSAYDANVSQLWNGASLKETFTREPYLLLSIAFVLSRACLYFFPGMASCLKALWVSCIPHLNLGIFGESRQLLWRVLHLIDFKRIWYKLNACKTRNFHKGARNARVWASSLASVSLGETSSPSRVLPCK